MQVIPLAQLYLLHLYTSQDLGGFEEIEQAARAAAQAAVQPPAEEEVEAVEAVEEMEEMEETEEGAQAAAATAAAAVTMAALAGVDAPRGVGGGGEARVWPAGSSQAGSEGEEEDSTEEDSTAATQGATAATQGGRAARQGSGSSLSDAEKVHIGHVIEVEISGTACNTAVVQVPCTHHAHHTFLPYLQ